MFISVRSSLDPMTTTGGARVPGAASGTVLVARRRRA